MGGSYYNQVARAEREGGAWRLYLTCGHSAYSAVPPESLTQPCFCVHCYYAAGRRAQRAADAELAKLKLRLGY